mgnify:CR=1 FL=1
MIIAEAGREEDGALRLGHIGYDHVAGYLEGGMESLENVPETVGRTVGMTPAERLNRPDSPLYWT